MYSEKVESKYSIYKRDYDGGDEWFIKTKDIQLVMHRAFSTRAQAFLAVGILEMLEENKTINEREFERLLITNNLLITGKEWIAE